MSSKSFSHPSQSPRHGCIDAHAEELYHARLGAHVASTRQYTVGCVDVIPSWNCWLDSTLLHVSASDQRYLPRLLLLPL
ncbi:hypothetical protein L1987_06836 [Smallanthus sonchifolius]|uniref:Uncharacterized protein n=1 Tax=Smallanthus sonchifolius TaxID=185202 RepID=A0ACB9JZF8_9ASTR|nr:hypothetical protein L1987_06836 [Smallanthus sonchifolius]